MAHDQQIKLSVEELEALIRQRMRERMRELGARGGRARAANLTRRQLRAIALKGVEARRRKAQE